METTDIFGKKPYKNTHVKSAKPSLDYCYVLAMRSSADRLSFSKMIYTQTQYLFYISQERFQVKELDKQIEFQPFIHKDIISDNKVFYLQNESVDAKKLLLGINGDALFQLKQKKQKRKNQSSFFFEEETMDFDTLNQETDNSEIRQWLDLKKSLALNAVNIAGKIDYLFPLRIETYEIIKPLLEYLPKMSEISYMLIEPKEIENAISFFMYIDLMMERIHSVGVRAPSLQRF